MIGYYIHHVGRGHLHLAMSIAGHLDQPVTALSSLARPPDWSDDWIQLPRDDENTQPIDPTAHGQLHWAPRYDRGLQDRMAKICDWIRDVRPAAIVVDVSVEVVVLSRLLGLPVITGTLPGIRQDPPHRLGHELADLILAPWPFRYHAIAPELARYLCKTVFIGAVSRFDTRESPPRAPAGARRVLVLEGLGGDSFLRNDLADLQAATPGWQWSALGAQNWLEDPWSAICAADVVVAHCGLGSLADVAAAGKPLIAIPASRPHDEQVCTAAALKHAGLAVVLFAAPALGEWVGLLDSAVNLGGGRWSEWSDRAGGARAAEAIDEFVRSRTGTVIV